jgi:hypothetical protein
MPGQGKTERQLDGVPDADAPSDLDARDAQAIVADLKGRFRIDEIEAVMLSSRDAHCLAQAAGAAG